ncbi:hypothetical protein BOTNAR_0128g00090 [Botryotinia narcissicola]|uniref:F-box domain-containing protein n=1 Tax=Botryotinia narcissicola TaxID=278944 RepID=A0A4Z1IIU8_9HELO|nr:hypothetical protein BOTNAR_0128g00090 [Botryotinia narcissicola]
MSIANLSTELLQRIYEYSDLIDILHLSQTSKQNYNALRGRRMPIIRQALDNEYGPIPSLVKLVMSDDSTKGRSIVGTGARRNIAVDRIIQVPDEPHLSIQLLSKMMKFGKAASRFVEIFPQFRWRLDYQDRRFLWLHEQRRLRRAIYNYWTYATLFHDEIYVQFNPGRLSGTRGMGSWFSPPVEVISDPRLRLIESFDTIEILQLNEFLQHMVKLIELDLFPSDSTIQSQYNFTPQAIEKIAWGYGEWYRCLVRNLLRYDPSDFIYLYDQTFTKSERTEYIFSRGFDFRRHNTPATLGDTISIITERRRNAAGNSHLFHPVYYQSGDSCLQGDNLKFGIADHPHEESYSNDHPFNNDGRIVLSTDENE